MTFDWSRSISYLALNTERIRKLCECNWKSIQLRIFSACKFEKSLICVRIWSSSLEHAMNICEDLSMLSWHLVWSKRRRLVRAQCEWNPDSFGANRQARAAKDETQAQMVNKTDESHPKKWWEIRRGNCERQSQMFGKDIGAFRWHLGDSHPPCSNKWNLENDALSTTQLKLYSKKIVISTSKFVNKNGTIFFLTHSSE